MGSTFSARAIATLGMVVVAGIAGTILSPESTTQIIGFCSVTSVSILTLIQAKHAAAKADVVAEDVRDTKRTGETVHALVNSAMGSQLSINAVLARRLAKMTKEPDDVAAAELAEKLYQAHEVKQRKVDEGRSRVAG